MTGARWRMAKSMMVCRFWIAKPSASKEIACGGWALIALRALVSSSRVRVGRYSMARSSRRAVSSEKARSRCAPGCSGLPTIATLRRSGTISCSSSRRLPFELDCHECHARHVAARSGKTIGETSRNGIGAHAEYDGNGQAETPNLESGCALRHDKIDGQSHQLRGEVGYALNHVVAVTGFDHEVAALDIAEICKGGAHGVNVRHQARRLLGGEPTDADDPRCALRGTGPRHGGHGDKGGHKHPSFHPITSSLGWPLWT